MSHAGRRARRERLIESGEWSPSDVLDAMLPAVDARAKAMMADRDDWLRTVGFLGWQREQDRRRAARIARHRKRRSA